MKKILVLGGKPIGSCEIVEYAHSLGLHTIVADYLPVEASPAKRIADEHWEISTADVDALADRCQEAAVDAVVTGVHEFNICRKIELCERLKLPQYCTMEQWLSTENKRRFKEICAAYGIPVASTYHKEDTDIQYPVIVKPTDSSGSRGFSICHNYDELIQGIELALKFSTSKSYLIEEYYQCDACIIHYTAVDGEIIFSGMSDKYSQKFEGGSSVMALQFFPSKSIAHYLDTVNEKAIAMFKGMGVKNGPIWIEAFNDIAHDKFVFNEMGYRFGGSMTNYPVMHFYGFDQLGLMVDNALGNTRKEIYNPAFVPDFKNYCILPLHLHPGTIRKIEGIEEAKGILGLKQIVFVHFEGDEIQNWGTAQQVCCYVHIAFNTKAELSDRIAQLKKRLHVIDNEGNEMLFSLFDTTKLPDL